MISMDNEQLPGLAAYPADVSGAIGQHNGCVDFMRPESEVYEHILSMGIELVNVVPAIRAKLGDGPPCHQSEWFLFGGRDSQFSSSQIYQHRGFQILDMALWWHFNERRVMDQKLC